MEHDPPKRSDPSPGFRRWLVVAGFTGVMLLGLPVFPMMWNALAAGFPVFTQMATVLFLPVGLLALIIGIYNISGKQSKGFFGLIVLLCVGFGILMQVMTITPVEQVHAAEYAVLAALVYRAPATNIGPWARGLIALTYACIMGVVDEMIQYVLPNRVFDPRDIGLNWIAGGFGVLLSVLVDRRMGRWLEQREVQRGV